VKGVFTQIELIYDALKQNVRRSDIEFTPINIISTTASTNPDELDQSFMYSQLLKEIIVDIEYDKNAKTKFVNFCRQQYIDNDAMLKTIDEFEENYDRSKAIWWYTKESFIYFALNKALRTQDIETTIKMGFFVRDLHQQIQQLHSETHQSTKIVLYRGQGLSNDDLIKMKNSKGGLFAFNNFLSTSTDSQVSLVFAESARQNSDLTGILFKMEVNPSMSSTPFAPLKNISYYSESEEETLFSMHTVFRIGEIEQIEDRLWQVNLILTSDTDQELKHLCDFMRNELGGKTVWHRMYRLMQKMNKLEICIEAYIILLDTTSEDDPKEFATLLTETLEYAATAYYLRACCKNAPSSLKMTPEIQQISLAPHHTELATTYNNIGNADDWMEDYEIAVLCYEKIIEMQQKYLPPNHPKLATTYNHIAVTHQNMGHHSTALSYFEKTLEIKQKSLPPNHPDLAKGYSSIGETYQSMGDHSTALSYFEKTLEIRQKSLPPNHPDLATTYSSIGETHQSMGDHSTALSYFEKTLEIQLKSLPHEDPSLIVTCFKILEVCDPTDVSAITSCLKKISKVWQK
jgi:tetratricopeptide (TPR) repeat protein